jgi:roadblock/LC7 domain-containing protein
MSDDLLDNIRAEYELTPRDVMESGFMGDIARLIAYAEHLERRVADLTAKMEVAA